MKKGWIILLACLLLTVLAVSAAMADGELAWDSETNSYYFTTPRYGIVICTKLTVRCEASTRAKSYGLLKNGEPVKILGTTEKSDFYILDLPSCGFNNIAADATVGYVKTGMIKIDPEYIYSGKLLNLYATPWSLYPSYQYINTPKLKNGEQDGRYFIVIEQSDHWYAVQATDEKAGSAFIRIKDVPINNVPVQDINGFYYTPARYVVTWDAPLLQESTWAQLDVVKKYTSGELLADNGDYMLLVFEKGTEKETRGYINKLYLAPIIN